MRRASSPFAPGAVLALLAVGAGAFLLFLYALGAGWTGHDRTSGAGHAASNALNGYAGLVDLLERQGLTVSISRKRAQLDAQALLVLTPEYGQDPDKLAKLLRARRQEGPTLLILPKWPAEDVSRLPGVKNVRHGWVMLGDAQSPEWFKKVGGFEQTDVRLAKTGTWEGLGRGGKLPAAQVQSIFGPNFARIVGDGHGGSLVAFLDDGGYYPTLLPLAGRQVDEKAPRRWAVTVVAEPDLFNNGGLADQDRARLAVQLVRAAREDQSLPVVFDLTLAGLGASANLLTLAFEPPFLAATLCLLLAGVVVAWRGLARFGPPLAEAPALAFGKAQLAKNGGGLIERSRRLHLLGPPYAALLATRIAARLGVREVQPEARDNDAARLLDARGLAADYPARLDALRHARKAGELIRAAVALKSIERTL